ncbi:MAG: Gfo/Idh/MocA family oxidoreductase [Caldilineaceae bacterium]|nr:Gfo/Idh/MocA family oxidoreductase [Caldilineaceae bacterium]
MATLSIAQKAVLPTAPRPIVSIGAGGIVHDAHYPAYQKAGFAVAGLFDAKPERAQWMASHFNVPTVYGSLADVAAQAPADAIFDIAVPASQLIEVLRQLPKDRAVLIQKPMGENLGQAREILALCQAKQLTAAINFQMRWAPFIIAARSLIEQGRIGEVHDMEVRVTVYTPWHLWPFLQQVPYAEILYHSIHYIDLVRSFLGEPQGVYAKTVRHPKLPQMQSRTNLIFDYGDTVRCNVETNHHHEYGLRHQESYVKWEGTQGAIIAKMGLLMNYPTGMPDTFEYCMLRAGQEPQWQTLTLEGSWFPEAFIGSMASLMRYVAGETDQLPTTVADAFQTMAVADAACRASDTGATAIFTE